MLLDATEAAHGRARSSAAALTAAVLVAIALCCGAQSAHAADTAARPAADSATRAKASSSSIRIEAKSDLSKGEDVGTDASSSGNRGSHIRIETDDDFPAADFQAAVEQMPWIIGLIFLVVGSIFLTPVVLAIGLIWYKLRKTRLQNEAMLALAEKGVVPPAQAADALAAGTPPASVAPQVYQQALAQRKRAVWSDLRKGILMTMIGLALSLYSVTGEGSPNWLGLVLTFVGLGYLALWWLEGRHLEHTGSAAGNGGAKPDGG